MEQTNQTILIIGATGAMGSYVIRHLLADQAHQWKLRAFTRDPSNERARALEALSSGRVELFQGDSNNAESLRKAMRGVYGVFCNTDFWAAGDAQTEIVQGKTILEAAKAVGVEHFVYSSLENCTKISGGKIPVAHFDSKAIVENFIYEQRAKGEAWFCDRTTVLVTAPYIESFQSYTPPEKVSNADGTSTLVFTLAMADKPWTMVALEDIGWFASYIFAHPQDTLGHTLRIASDSLPLVEIAGIFTRVTGLPARYNAISIEEFEKSNVFGGKNSVNLFRFLQEYGLERDFEQLRRIHPGLLSFEGWLKQSGWRGEPVAVQKHLQDQATPATA